MRAGVVECFTTRRGGRSMFRRHRQRVGLRLLRTSTVGSAVAEMRRLHSEDGYSRRELRLKLSDDGKVAASRAARTRGPMPPHLKGRLQADGDRVVFEGVVTEAHSSVFVPRTFVGLAVIMAVTAVGLVVAGNPTPGTYVCGVSAVLFGLLGRAISRQREDSFRIECDRLAELLAPLLPHAIPFDEKPGS